MRPSAFTGAGRAVKAGPESMPALIKSIPRVFKGDSLTKALPYVGFLVPLFCRDARALRKDLLDRPQGPERCRRLVGDEDLVARLLRESPELLEVTRSDHELRGEFGAPERGLDQLQRLLLGVRDTSTPATALIAGAS